VIFERALMSIAAIAAIAAAAATSVVAAAFAIFALLRPEVGSAGAAAIVAAIFALIVGLAGAVAAARGRRNVVKAADRDPMRLAERVMDLVRDKPLAAAGVALAAGLMAIRSPQAIGAIARAFFDSWTAGKPDAR
jgi:hypothetical protein